MVALPRYVRPITKANGRRYYYFEKFRGTPAAWPRVPLPADPLSAEFITRIGQCERLEAEQIGAAWAFHFRDVTSRRHDLPSPASSEFWAAVDKAEGIGKKLSAGERKTFSALIVEFKNHDAYRTAISEGTRDQYDRYIKAIEEIWGDDPVAALTPEDAQRAVDSYNGTPAAARAFRATLSRLISWGIPRGYATFNPVEKTERPSAAGTYEPWEQWQFDLFFRFTRPGLHLPVYSALFTGQRSVDVFQMRQPAPKATEMPLVAQKTGERVPVQIHSEYRSIIDAAVGTATVPLRPDDAPLLHRREDGAPWTQDGFETAWQRQMTLTAPEGSPLELRERAEAMAKLRGARTVFHGLRKNAVIMLLEAGCTEKEVQKIVGMSAAMVEHYSKRVNARRLAIAAMKKLEAGWAETRKALLGPKINTA